jgi:NAD dependent epimerase/dehydratase family enzyme
LGELADEALLASTRVEPRKLTDGGFQFKFPDLESALESLL